MDSIDITAIAPKIEKFVKKEGKLLSASSLTLPLLSPLPLGSWSTFLLPYVQGPWLWSHLLSHFCLLPFPILISLLHPFPLYSVSHPPILFSLLGPRLTSLHLFACLSSLMPVSSILACVFLSVLFSLLSLASLSCLACLNLVFFFDSLLSLVCHLWLVALCVCVCVELC